MAYNIKKDKNPTAINILKLQRYNFSFFKLEEVIFFEYLIVKGQAFGFKQFYHSTETIGKETGIKRSKLKAIITKFTELGIIDVEVLGFPKVKHFTVNYLKIYDYLPKIYKSAENGKLSADMNKLLTDFYQPLVHKYLQKNINKNIQEENKKEKKEIDFEEKHLFSSFRSFLLTLRLEFDLSQAQIKYEPSLVHHVLSNYEENVVFDSLHSYFSVSKHSKSVNKFLTLDELVPEKNFEIEYYISEQNKYIDKITSDLEETYNSRRRMDKTKKYSETKLVINKQIKEKLSAALKRKGEQALKNSFIAYADAVIKEKISPDKLLPYFLSQKNGEYEVLDIYLDYFNSNYSIS